MERKESPSEVFTFLFTDIEGSSALWEADPEKMNAIVEVHDGLIRKAIESRGGDIFKTMGDAFLVAFRDPTLALAATLAFQLDLQREELTRDVKVRSALYTGEAYQRDGDYFGPALNRAARLVAVGHGGQVLIASSTVSVLDLGQIPGIELLDLGLISLRGITQSEKVYQLVAQDLPKEFAPLRTGLRPPNNLPRSLTMFVGRENELREVGKALEKSPIVTLVGSGGCGKSRLAIEHSRMSLDQFPDGTWFIELAPLTDAGQVVREILSTLQLNEDSSGDLVEYLIRQIREKQMLLILDNCEHLISECARLGDRLLTGVPGIKILATSREPLGLPGEIAFRIPSLSTGAENGTVGDAELLFIDRAKQAMPDLALDSAMQDSVTQICQRLDGIPLAIELAAARIKSMSPEQIASRLDDRFRLLTGGPRTALPRQQTLRAAIDWSYNLLTPLEKVLLTRLSVFQGGWTLPAAEAVCQDEELADWEILDVHTSLVEKSLIVIEKRQRAGESRYRLLETVRQYLREKFLDMEAGLRIRDQHRTYFASLIAELEPALLGRGQRQAIESIDTELDNIRTAMEWASSSPSGQAELLSMAKGTHLYWEVRGRMPEGKSWMELAISSGKGSESPDIQNLVMRCQNNLGAICNALGFFEEAQDHLTSAMDYAEKTGFELGIAVLCNNLGICLHRLKRHEEAKTVFERGIEITRSSSGVNPRALLLDNLGMLISETDPVAAHPLVLEAQELFRSVSDTRGQVVTLYHSGEIYRLKQQPVESMNALKEAMALALTLNYELVVVGSLEAVAKSWSEHGRHQDAAEIYAGAKRIRDSISLPYSGSGLQDLERWLQLTRTELGEEAFESASSKGASMSMEALVSLILDQ